MNCVHKIIMTVALLLFVNTLSAQNDGISVKSWKKKSYFSGQYLMGKTAMFFNTDTVIARLFLTADSFKIVYLISVKSGSDCIIPVKTGTWKLLKKGKIEFDFSDGKIVSGVFNEFILGGSIITQFNFEDGAKFSRGVNPSLPHWQN